MQILFISDLHLGHHSPELVRGFFHFLNNQAANADQLYILGDFFDAWLGDDDDDALVAEIKGHLHDYAQNHQVFFLHGNRDFLLGEQFARDTCITLLPESHLIELNGKKALLMHGDTLCTQDTEYLKFRAMVRNPAWQQQVLSLPLPQRRQMAADLRNKSQSMNAMKAEDIMDVTPAEVERVMDSAGVDLLIHGHTHRPTHHSLTVNNAPAERWVLGDWSSTAGWYLAAEHGELNLTKFDLATSNPISTIK
jgi:UDP-2,3-diacylglucosamine hydrolase